MSTLLVSADIFPADKISYLLLKAFTIFISVQNHVNVYFYTEPLLNGHRYAICIHANAAVLKHKDRTESLPEITTCSDGITVDKTPPVTGDVWIYHKGAIHQVWNYLVYLVTLNKIYSHYHTLVSKLWFTYFRHSFHQVLLKHPFQPDTSQTSCKL